MDPSPISARVTKPTRAALSKSSLYVYPTWKIHNDPSARTNMAKRRLLISILFVEFDIDLLSQINDEVVEILPSKASD